MASVKEQLYADFEKMSSRRIPGGTDYQYIEWEDVVDRLNNVFGVHWSSHVEYQDVVNNQAIVRIRVTIQDPESGNTFWQEGFGGSSIREKDEPGSYYNAAYAKALRSACKKWGVGLYLDEEREESRTTHAESTPMPAKPTAPPMAETIKFPGQHKPPQAPANKPPVGEFPEPPKAATPARTIPVAPPMHMPPVSKPEAATGIKTGQLPPELPASSKEDGSEPLTLVQKAALQSILSISNCPYEKLVAEAFEHYGKPTDKIPEVDDLTREEVRGVILYGNSKFRN